MALIYRAHYALIRSPRFTSGGICTSAVFGVANTLLDILKSWEPTHLAMAIDAPGPTHRDEVFPEYKAQRDELPEDIASQIPLVIRLMQAMNIQVIQQPGVEADDVIGTLALEAAQAGFQVWMVTPDKDFQQLVSDRIKIFKPGRQGAVVEILGVPQVLEKWGVERVDQVIDILGLMGDASDNVPGVPGIGEKTAQKLIAKFGSLENLLKHTDQLKGKQREKLEANADIARLSKRLVTIVRDVPHQRQLDELELREFHQEQLQTLFAELEFETLGKRLFGNDFSVNQSRAKVVREKREQQIQGTLFDEPVQEKTIRDVEHDYKLITDAAERQEVLAQLLQAEQVCLDLEATGLDPRTASPLGIAFSIQPHQGWYVACDPDPEQARLVLEDFRPFFENTSILKIGHNLKYDLSLLKWHGFDVLGNLFDTMLAHSIKEPEMKHGLDYLARLYLAYQPISFRSLVGENDGQQRSLLDVPPEDVADYACEDADVTLQLSQAIRREIEEHGVAEVCFQIECPLLPVLVDMEFEGIRLDTDALRDYAKKLEREIESLRCEIFKAVGHSFNIDSPKQLGVALFDELQLETNPKKTATGQYSTRETELQRLAGKHPIVRDILEYRHAVKLKSVYVDQLPNAVNPQTGRVHTHYEQTWTATGRMQSTKPNLQTIPVRKERGREIRAAFIPRNDDYLILAADYSQIELRIMAELSGDDAMQQAFLDATDIHAATAAKVYQVDLADVTRQMRDKAKTVNFGIIYGISAFGLQQRLNITRAEANELIQGYFQEYPGVQDYIDRTIEFAREHGYVATRLGRRRYLRDINSRNHGLRKAAERLAMNSPIQGTAADMLKLAMIKTHQALNKAHFNTKMLLTVHDEIVFDLFRDEQERVVPLIIDCMKTAMPMNVPIEVETGIGSNWLQAH